jgi:hypothetical protein
VDGLRDRSSRRRSSPSKTPLTIRDAVEALRRQRRTEQHIAETLGLSPATVSRILRARGLSLVSALEPQHTRPRYERAMPSEMIHIDIKKLGRFDRVGHRITGDRTAQSNSRGIGREYAHVAIDDHSRVATANILSGSGRTLQGGMMGGGGKSGLGYAGYEPWRRPVMPAPHVPPMASVVGGAALGINDALGAPLRSAATAFLVTAGVPRPYAPNRCDWHHPGPAPNRATEEGSLSVRRSSG